MKKMNILFLLSLQFIQTTYCSGVFDTHEERNDFLRLLAKRNADIEAAEAMVTMDLAQALGPKKVIRKPVECPICKKKLSQGCHFAEYLHTHTGEKPFQCGQCLQRFRRKQTLKTHGHSLKHDINKGATGAAEDSTGKDPVVIEEYEDVPALIFIGEESPDLAQGIE